MPIRRVVQGMDNVRQVVGQNNGHHYGHYRHHVKHHHHHHHHQKAEGFSVMNGYRKEFRRFMKQMAPSDATKTRMAGLAVLGAVVVSSGLIVKGLMNVFKTNNTKISEFNKDLTNKDNLIKLKKKLEKSEVKVSFLGTRALNLPGKHKLTVSLNDIKSQLNEAKKKLVAENKYIDGTVTAAGTKYEEPLKTDLGQLVDTIEKKLGDITKAMEECVGEQNPITRAIAHFRG